MRLIRVAVGQLQTGPTYNSVVWGTVERVAGAWRNLPTPRAETGLADISIGAFDRCACFPGQVAPWWPGELLQALDRAGADKIGLRVFVIDADKVHCGHWQALVDLRSVRALRAFTLREYMADPEGCTTAQLVPVRVDFACQGEIGFTPALERVRRLSGGECGNTGA